MDGKVAEEKHWFKIEKNHVDFPFYNGEPFPIPLWRWLIALAGAGLGFAFLFMTLPVENPLIKELIHAAGFIALPIIGLLIANPKSLKYIFRPMGKGGIRTIILVVLVGFLISFAMGFVVNTFFPVASNPINATLDSLSTWEKVLMYLFTSIQLMGEELITIIPFLFIMQVLFGNLKMKRKPAVLIAWVVTAVIFGLLHLSTYGWNVAHVLLVIGLTRIVLTYAYVKTKSIWACFIAHVLFDFSVFTLGMFT